MAFSASEKGSVRLVSAEAIGERELTVIGFKLMRCLRILTA